MIPFAAWSQGRLDLAARDAKLDSKEPEEKGPSDFELEFSTFLDELIENLMTSSASQLRSTLVLMEKTRAELQQATQESHVANELSRIEDTVSKAVGDALLPVLNEAHQCQVMKEFAAILKKILPEFAEQSLLIKAPLPVHDELREMLQNQSINAEIVSNDNGEIRVAGSQVVLLARLGEWSERLKGVASQ
jgi:hypothetical protein